jgi:hypothetical protein
LLAPGRPGASAGPPATSPQLLAGMSIRRDVVCPSRDNPTEEDTMKTKPQTHPNQTRIEKTQEDKSRS